MNKPVNSMTRAELEREYKRNRIVHLTKGTAEASYDA